MYIDTSTIANNFNTATAAREIHLVHLSCVVLLAFVTTCRRGWGHCCCDVGVVFVTFWLARLGPICPSAITRVDQPEAHKSIISVRTLFSAKELSADINLTSFLPLAIILHQFKLFLIGVCSSAAVQNLQHVDNPKQRYVKGHPVDSKVSKG